MLHPGLPLAKICTLAAVVITMFTAATNKVAVGSITTISSSTRSAVPHTLGPPTPTRTFTTTLNSSGADEIMIDDDSMLTVATNTAIPTLPRALHDPSAVRGASNLDSTTSHEGHHRVHDRGVDVHDVGFFDIIMPGADYNNDYLLETCHSSAPPPRASVPRIERESAPPPRDRTIVAAIADDTTAITTTIATVAATAVAANTRN